MNVKKACTETFHIISQSNISEAAINCNTRQADEQALQQQNI